MCKIHWRVQIQHFDNLSSLLSLFIYFYIAFLLKFRNEHVNTMSKYLSWESWLSRCCVEIALKPPSRYLAGDVSLGSHSAVFRVEMSLKFSKNLTAHAHLLTAVVAVVEEMTIVVAWPLHDSWYTLWHCPPYSWSWPTAILSPPNTQQIIQSLGHLPNI